MTELHVTDVITRQNYQTKWLEYKIGKNTGKSQKSLLNIRDPERPQKRWKEQSVIYPELYISMLI
jgi:hypothetical protein